MFSYSHDGMETTPLPTRLVLTHFINRFEIKKIEHKKKTV